MEFITDIIPPAQLTGTVQTITEGGLPFAAVPPVLGAEPVNGPFVTASGLLNLFPIQQVDDIEYEIENTDLTGAGEVARYRSWDAVPPIGKRPGIEIIGGNIVPLGWSYRLNEKDLKRYGRLRQALATGTTADRADARVVDVLTGDAVRAAAAVQNRLTLAHADVLKNGSFTLTELGDPESGNALVATFPVPDNQKVTAGVLWSDLTNAVAINNLKAWEAVYAANNNGAVPDEWWIDSTQAAELVQHAKILNKLVYAVGTSNATSIPNIDVVNDILRVHGVQAPVRVVNVQRPPLAGGAASNVLGGRKVIGVKAGMGRTLFSPPASTSLMPAAAQIEYQAAAGIIAYAQAQVTPAQVMTTAEALAVPVLSNPNALFIATV